jgi:hypothetical protein
MTTSSIQVFGVMDADFHGFLRSVAKIGQRTFRAVRECSHTCRDKTASCMGHPGKLRQVDVFRVLDNLLRRRTEGDSRAYQDTQT